MGKKKNLKGIDEDDLRFINEKMSYQRRDSYIPCSMDFKVNFKACNPVQKAAFNSVRNKDVICTILSGEAGSGKTYVAMAALLKGVLEGRFQKIYFVIPTMEAASKGLIGLLPGTLEEKMLFYTYNCRNIIKNILKNSNIGAYEKITERLFENKIIDVTPISYLRGMTLDGAVCIDEAQSLDSRELYLILSRLGKSVGNIGEDNWESAKLVILGDMKQTDRTYKGNEKCGLSHAIRCLEDLAEVEHIHFNSELIVRNPFIKAVVDRWYLTEEELEKVKSEKKESCSCSDGFGEGFVDGCRDREKCKCYSESENHSESVEMTESKKRKKVEKQDAADIQIDKPKKLKAVKKDIEEVKKIEEEIAEKPKRRGRPKKTDVA